MATPSTTCSSPHAGRLQALRSLLLSSGLNRLGVLVFSEADGVPGLIADRYGDTVVCQLTTAGAEAWREVLADALFALPGVACVYERSDADVREREGPAPRAGLLRVAAGHRPGGARKWPPIRRRRGGRPQDGLLPRPARRPCRGRRGGGRPASAQRVQLHRRAQRDRGRLRRIVAAVDRLRRGRRWRSPRATPR